MDEIKSFIEVTCDEEFRKYVEKLVKSEEEINQAIEKRWIQHCNIVALDCPYCFTYDEIKQQELEIIYRDQYNASTFLSYYGAYIGCFTEESNSILMWSHYADSSKGINVEYNFSNIKNKSILKNILFPVCYSEKSIYVGDLKKIMQNHYVNILSMRQYYAGQSIKIQFGNMKKNGESYIYSIFLQFLIV